MVSTNAPTTAFVLAGGGSLGAVQVGMLAELAKAGVTADFVVGSSVGALNAGFYACDPTVEGVEKLAAVWRALRRDDIFRMTPYSLIRLFRGRDGLIDSRYLKTFIERHLSFDHIENAKTPLHVVATNLGGESVCLSSGPASSALLASAAIPVVFPAVQIGANFLMDGAISGNTPILTAAALGAKRIIVLPTGFACAMAKPPSSAVARGIHALTLLVAHQMVRDIAHVPPAVAVVTAPPLCPLAVSPFDFSQTEMLIARAADSTRRWLASGGLSHADTPQALRGHTH